MLVRGLCAPGGNTGVVICSPTFGMYAVAAALHGVPVNDVPQVDSGSSFAHDLGGVAQTARETNARVIFLATPDNPTGATIDLSSISALASDVSDQSLVVIDEAYAEFAGHVPARPDGGHKHASALKHDNDQRSAIALIEGHPNLAVLRTMSKAHALAGARVGALVAHPDLVAVLRRVQAPYPMPTPVVDLALAALARPAINDTQRRVAATLALRPRLQSVLAAHPSVRVVYRGAGNFVLVRCCPSGRNADGKDADGADILLGDAARSGIAVRDMRHLPGLDDAVRVSVGTAEEIEALIGAITTDLPESTAGPHFGGRS